MNGILMINKPQGITSHDVVLKIRKKFNIGRVGHAGTLDPLATGLLILLLGKSTKMFDQFVGMDKAYRATLILGTRTDTADVEGKITEQKPFNHIERSTVEDMFKNFTGEIDQVPPMYSAVKMGGKKLYQLARKGIEVERQARRINIYTLVMEKFESPEVKFFLKCSKGTYVRQLAEDVGERLGCGACISQIERTEIGPFSLTQAVTLEDASESHIQNWRG